VKVKVLSADPKTKRIALSVKALQQPDLPKIKNAPKPEREQRPAPTMEGKLAQLQARFQKR
jgi:uncharacterized protein